MADMTREQLEQEVLRLRAKLATKGTQTLTFKVGEKGGVSVYGLGRFPVSLYYSQWKRLISVAADLEAFLEEKNAAGVLKHKDE